MKTKQKLSPKEKLLKSLETRANNLRKKRLMFQKEFSLKCKDINEEMSLINIQLSALKKK